MILRKIHIIYIILFFAFCVTPINLFPFEIDYADSEKFRVLIYFDKFTFYHDDPVNLKIQIKNNSFKKEKITIYDSLYTTFQPVVYDMNAREAEIIVPYKLMNKQIDDIVKQAVSRKIILSPNESIIHTINLKEIYSLQSKRKYRVKCFFFPDAVMAKAIPGESVLIFKIIDSISTVKKSGIERMRIGITPSEIIYLFLQAEKSKNWDNYIKYLKLNRYINAFPNFVKTYNSADEKEKLKVEEDFIKFLSKDRNDYILDFNVINENIVKNKKIAYVNVMVRRFGIKWPFTYKYKYTLEKFRDFWLIIDVEAIVMKGKR